MSTRDIKLMRDVGNTKHVLIYSTIECKIQKTNSESGQCSQEVEYHMPSSTACGAWLSYFCHRGHVKYGFGPASFSDPRKGYLFSHSLAMTKTRSYTAVLKCITISHQIMPSRRSVRGALMGMEPIMLKTKYLYKTSLQGKIKRHMIYNHETHQRFTRVLDYSTWYHLLSLQENLDQNKYVLRSLRGKFLLVSTRSVERVKQISWPRSSPYHGQHLAPKE